MTTLKDRNRAALITALVFQALLLWAALAGQWGWEVDSLGDGLKRFGQTSPFAAILGVVVFVLQGSLSSDTKARLVFWKFRGDPYPGSQAFSKWMRKDSRIDANVITSRHGTLPKEPKKQNALWYKLLKTHESKSSVEDAHRRYLLGRDLATNWLLFGVVAGMGVWLGKGEWWVKLGFDAGMLLGYVILAWVASNHGIRLVTSVLAAESSE